MIRKYIVNLSHTLARWADARLLQVAAWLRRKLWKITFIIALFGVVVSTTTYTIASLVLPHVHNIYSAAKLIDGEARGESRRGQRAVFSTILVRMEDKRFPDTMHGVIYQPYPKNPKILQYNAVGDHLHEDLSTEPGQRILIRAMWWYVQSKMGIFRAPKEARGAHSYCVPAACERQSADFGRYTFIGKIGNHNFYGNAEPVGTHVADTQAVQMPTRPKPKPACIASEQSFAPCTSIRPKPKAQFPSLDEQSAKGIEAIVAEVVATDSK